MNDEHVETALEVGLGLFGAVLLGGLGVLIFSKIGGGVTRGKRHAEGPPNRGSVPADRQQNIGSSSPR